MNILVISPHPDDETLGCGGTLLKHKNNNNNIYWIIVTNPSNKDYSKEFITKRNEEIALVRDKYQMDQVFKLDYSPASLDNTPIKNLIGDIANIFKQIKPEIIYLPFRNDIHTDHKVVFDSVLSCTKSFRYPFIRKVLAYETVSETEFAAPLGSNIFQPNCFSDISDFMEEKIEIMNIYSSEMGQHPFPRSEKNLRALATFRGAIAGVEYAESFMILKEIF
jgi:LmbE family N-acetylglucosaminyl deacetylase